jgi:hypothetical protein
VEKKSFDDVNFLWTTLRSNAVLEQLHSKDDVPVKAVEDLGGDDA